MSPSHAEVIPADTGNMTHARTTDTGSPEAADMGSAEATHMATTKATDVATTKAAHVAATKAASMPAAATAASLRTRGGKASGKQCGCQNHHPSSFHDLSPLEWAGIPPRDLHQALARLNKANAGAAMD